MGNPEINGKDIMAYLQIKTENVDFSEMSSGKIAGIIYGHIARWCECEYILGSVPLAYTRQGEIDWWET